MTNNLRVLSDESEFVGYSILEDNNKSGRMRVRGVFQRADVKNANGRIYSRALWERVLSNPSLQEALENRRMHGEVEHPKDGTTNLNRISHTILSLKLVGNEIIGEAEILNTPAGKIIQEIFRSGGAVGISSRGRGTSVLRDGIEYVDENSYCLDTFDFVYKPSTPGAFPTVQEALSGPYSKDSTMNEKIEELKRLEVAAMDVTKSLEENDTSSLQSGYQKCIELEASADTLISSLSEEEVNEHKELIEGVLEKIQEGKAMMVTHMDTILAGRRGDLDRRVDNALESDDEEVEEEGDESSSGTGEGGSEGKGAKTESSSRSINRLRKKLESLKDLLREVREDRDFLADRLAETLEILEADDDELRRRYVAAKSLGNELVARLKESQDALSQLLGEHQELEERYRAATELVAGVVERQDRSRIVRRVREAVESCPELQPFSRSLLSCETMEELEERIDEFSEALNLPTQDKDEALVGQVSLSALRDDDETWDNDSMTDGTPLPTSGASINESQDSDILSQARELNEGIEDRGVLAVRRLIKSRNGWK